MLEAFVYDTQDMLERGQEPIRPGSVGQRQSGFANMKSQRALGKAMVNSGFLLFTLLLS